MPRRALVNCVQEISEAAARISEAGRARLARVPWKKIVGMRHRSIHDYSGIDSDLLWPVVEQELQPLITTLEAALPDWAVS